MPVLSSATQRKLQLFCRNKSVADYVLKGMVLANARTRITTGLIILRCRRVISAWVWILRMIF
jgi:hypothetical protein